MLVFDEWVTSDTSITSTNVLTGLLNYQINGGAPQTITVNYLVDNYANNLQGSFSASDGYLHFFDAISLAPGQTLIALPSTFTFSSGGANFNQPPAVFNGNAYLIDTRAVPISNLVNVNTVAPEPSTWVSVLAGAGLLGLRLRRRPLP